jgi:hypothetical protein
MKQLFIFLTFLLLLLYIIKNINVKENFRSSSTYLNKLVNSNMYNLQKYYTNHPIHHYKKNVYNNTKLFISKNFLYNLL